MRSLLLLFSMVICSAALAQAPTDSLIVHYTFDEADGAVAVDQSGNGNDGYLKNNPERVEGVNGYALQFNGSDNYVVNDAVNGLPTGSSSRTMTFWAKYDVAQPGKVFAGYGSTSKCKNFQFGFDRKDATKLGFYGWNSCDYTTSILSNLLADGVFHHFAVVYDGSLVKFYIDGILQSTAKRVLQTGSSTLCIAGEVNRRNCDRLFAGSIDDFRIYSRVLSDAEISSFQEVIDPLPPQTELDAPVNLAEQESTENTTTIMWDAVAEANSYIIFRDGEEVGSTTIPEFQDSGLQPAQTYTYEVYSENDFGTSADAAVLEVTTLDNATECAYQGGSLIHHFKGDQLINGNGVVDSISGVTGSAIGVDINAEAKVGQSLWFPQSASEARVDFGSFAPAASGGLSASFWIKPSNLDSAEARYISKARGVGGADHDFMVSAIDYTGLRFRLRADGGTTTLATSSGLLQVGQWSHVVVTYDESKMKIYHNGVLVASTSKSGAVNYRSDTLMAFGNQPVGMGERQYSGLLDDVRFYQGALTQNEVQLMFDGVNGDCNTNTSIPPISAPQVLSGSVVDGSVALNWEVPTQTGAGVSHYQVFRNQILLSDNVTNLSYVDDTAEPDTLYSYSVRAVDYQNVLSAFSNEIQLTIQIVDTQSPTPPTGLQLVDFSDTSLVLSWTPSSDLGGGEVANYRLYRDGEFHMLLDAAVTFFTDTGLTPDTQYVYEVSAIDDSQNESLKSSSFIVSTLPTPTDTSNNTNTGGADEPVVVGDVVVKNSSELAAALSAAAGGEVILLKDGDYGSLTIKKQYADYVILRAENRYGATFTGIEINGSNKGYVHFDRIKSNGIRAVYGAHHLKYTNSKFTETVYFKHANHVVVRNNVVDVNGGLHALLANYLSDFEIVENYVAHAQEDLMRITGNSYNGLVENNVFYDTLPKNKSNCAYNHTDGLQFFGTDGKNPRDMIIRGNYFYDDPSNNAIRPPECVSGKDNVRLHMQGIFMAGPQGNGFERMVIEENFVFVGSPNALFVHGASNDVTVRNNTLLSWEDGKGGSIILRDGMVSNSGLTIYGNITSDFSDQTSRSSMKVGENFVYDRDDATSSVFKNYLFQGGGQGSKWQDFLPTAGSPIDFGKGFGALNRLMDLKTGVKQIPSAD